MLNRRHVIRDKAHSSREGARGDGAICSGAIFIGTVFVLVIGGIIFAVVKGIGTWSWNNGQPVQTAPARVVSKQTNTSGMGTTMDSGGSVSTSYYVAFEQKSRERHEFGLSGREYGLLAEGDAGTLTSQGTRSKGFVRRAV